jgi:hypothetical protein
MNIETDAFKAKQAKAVQAVINNIEWVTKLSYDEIVRPESERAIEARKNLICALGCLGLKLWKIEKITKTHHTECWRIFNDRRKKEQAVRTMNWEVFA